MIKNVFLNILGMSKGTALRVQFKEMKLFPPTPMNAYNHFEYIDSNVNRDTA